MAGPAGKYEFENTVCLAAESQYYVPYAGSNESAQRACPHNTQALELIVESNRNGGENVLFVPKVACASGVDLGMTCSVAHLDGGARPARLLARSGPQPRPALAAHPHTT